MRQIHFIPGFTKSSLASVLVETGKTRVLVTVSMQEKVPPHVSEGYGWLTGEYAMLPGSTHTRTPRERNHVGGRTAEIQRLLGRSLRMAVGLERIPGITLTVDADVLEADGGTRTASINGGMLALAIAGKKLQLSGRIERTPVIRWIGAISAGIINGKIEIDLDYSKDSQAHADCNFVFSEHGEIIEIQATAEREPMNTLDFESLRNGSLDAVQSIIRIMKECESAYDYRS